MAKKGTFFVRKQLLNDRVLGGCYPPRNNSSDHTPPMIAKYQLRLDKREAFVKVFYPWSHL